VIHDILLAEGDFPHRDVVDLAVEVFLARAERIGSGARVSAAVVEKCAAFRHAISIKTDATESRAVAVNEHTAKIG